MITNVEVKELEDLYRELTIEVAAEDFNQKMEQEFTNVKRDVAIKGFRKGKVPMNIIKANYAEVAREKAVDSLIRDSYQEAVQTQTLKVASPPTITELDLSDEGVLKYTAKVEVFPVIDNITYKDLKISSENVEVTDEEVDEFLERLRHQHAEMRVLERAALDTDIVNADLKKIHDPKLVMKDEDFPGTVIDLGSQVTLMEFREQIPGMKAGDEKEIEVKYADDYPEKDFAGAEITYHCKINSVSERIMPRVDDVFAKQTGQAETILELKLKIREEIGKHKKDEQQRRHKNMLIGQVCEQNQIPVPQTVLNDYLDRVIADFKEKGSDEDEESIRNQYRMIGTNSFRWSMVYHTLADQEKIEVLPSDTENLIKTFAENYKITPAEATESLQKSGRISDIKESILEEKVLDFLIDKAEVVKEKKK